MGPILEHDLGIGNVSTRSFSAGGNHIKLVGRLGDVAYGSPVNLGVDRPLSEVKDPQSILLIMSSTFVTHAGKVG